MKIEVYRNAESVAQKAAALVAAEARAAVSARGSFVMAVSGGHTPWQMLLALADEDVPWDSVHVVQVDERVAPAGDPDRNLTHLRESLLEHAPLRPERIHAMPVESSDLQAACEEYALTLQGSRRFTACPRPRSPGTRTRRPHGFTRAWGRGSRDQRCRCRAHCGLPGKATHDADLSNSQSLPRGAVARDWKRKGGDVSTILRGRHSDSGRQGPCGSRTGVGGSSRSRATG